MSLTIPLGMSPYDDSSEWVSAAQRFVGNGFEVWAHDGLDREQGVVVKPKSRDQDAWLQWVVDNLNPLVKHLKRWRPRMSTFQLNNSHLTRAMQKALREGRISRP